MKSNEMKKKVRLDVLALYIGYSTCSGYGYFKTVRPLAGHLWRQAQSGILNGVLIKILGFVALVGVALALDWYFELWCNLRPIQGMPALAGGLPLAGNFFQHGPSAAMTYWNVGLPVFQLRNGTRRVVVANSYESIYSLWQTNWKASISRPTLHTFHKVMSSSQGTTIGTTPYSESWKRMRKAIAANLNASAIKSYNPIIDSQISRCIECLEANVGREVDVHSSLATFALCIVSLLHVATMKLFF